MPFPILPILGAAVSAGQAASGLFNLKDDKAELARLSPAFYDIQDEYYGNNNQAAELAQGGFTASSTDYFTDMASRGLGTSISGVLQGGGSVNDVARIFDSYNDNIRSFASADSEKQIDNIRYFQQTGKDLAGQKTTQWAINEYQPQQAKLKELTERIAADKQNIWGGITGALGAAQAGVTASQNQDLLSKLFPDSKGGVSELPDGQKMWMDWKAQQERDNAAQGTEQLTGKFNPEKPPKFYIPDELGLSEDQLSGLYKYINRGR